MSEQGSVLSRRMFGVAVAAAMGLVACGRSSDDPAPGPSAGPGAGAPPMDPRSIATDAYIFGYPLVLLDATRANVLTSAPLNSLRNAVTLPTPQRRTVVRPNLDTPYSTAWLDLTAEPLVLRVPAMDLGRYWLMQVLDAWTDTVHNPSSVRPGTTAGGDSPVFEYAITGPGWTGTLPEGLTRLAVPTPAAWLLGRIQVDGPGDLPVVRGIQEQLELLPLSAFLAGERVPPAPAAAPVGTVPPPRQVAELPPHAFFERLCALLAVNPPAPADDAAMRRFAALGIRGGGALTGIAEPDLLAAVDAARGQLAEYRDPKARTVHGWTFDTKLGAYGTDYALRAATALRGLGANLPEDAVYPTLSAEADTAGTPNRFRLRFERGSTPPVDAFWSLTAYDADGYLVPNPAGIHAVGHQMPVARNPDGSLELAIQHADPGPSVPAGNWLPIPAAGRFSLTMRLYAPKDAALDGSWQVPALTKVE